MENERNDSSCFSVFHIIIKVHRRVRQGELPKGQEKVPQFTLAHPTVNPFKMIKPVQPLSTAKRKKKTACSHRRFSPIYF